MRLPTDFRFLAARDLGEAVRALADHGPEARVVAGGTDLYPNMKRRQQEPKLVIGAGRYVAVEGTMTGTMKGKLRGLEPSNQSGTLHFLDVFELRDGKIARHTSYMNSQEFFGAFVPAPKQKPKPAKK